MNMEVSAEAEDEFPVDELGSADDQTGSESEYSEGEVKEVSETGSDVDSEVVFGGKNNNATRCKDLGGSRFENEETVCEGRSSQSNKDEELEFMERFAVFMEKRGYVQKQEKTLMKRASEAGATKKDNKRSKEQTTDKDGGHSKGENEINSSNSEVTIYKRVVALSLDDSDSGKEETLKHQEKMRNSSSSDELIDTSDEINEINGIDDFIPEKRGRMD